MPVRACLVVALILSIAPAALARPIVHDTVGGGTPAAVSCGFCGGEKFGVVFRQITGRAGSLQPSEFPLQVDNVHVVVARATVTGGISELAPYSCMGSTMTGTLPIQIEVYAGVTPPTAVAGMPAGMWPGETSVFSMSAELTPSVETSAGSQMYDVAVNTVPIGGVRVEPPNTYIRVAVQIPSGGSSTACVDGGLPSPAVVGLRDNDGRIDSRVNLIYAVGGVADHQWVWAEDAGLDPVTLMTGVNGDWAIRLDVTSLGTPDVDAGPGVSDAGSGAMDAGPTSTDAGMIVSTPDGGTAGLDAGPMCVMDVDCAGGERCVGGVCRRLACTTATDCAGGMTCVEGMCRNLCTSNAECLGGEVCDTALGHCVPVGGMTTGGCGCRVHPGVTNALGLVFLTLGALLLVRSKRRIRGVR